MVQIWSRYVQNLNPNETLELQRVEWSCLRINDRLRLVGRGTVRAEDAQGTPTQSHISPSILVYEDEQLLGFTEPNPAQCDRTSHEGEVS